MPKSKPSPSGERDGFVSVSEDRPETLEQLRDQARELYERLEEHLSRAPSPRAFADIDKPARNDKNSPNTDSNRKISKDGSSLLCEDVSRLQIDSLDDNKRKRRTYGTGTVRKNLSLSKELVAAMQTIAEKRGITESLLVEEQMRQDPTIAQEICDLTKS